MNKWFRRAVGTVGVAGGMLLLGAGTAHADDSALDDLNNLGLSLDTPGSRVSAGTVDGGPLLVEKNTGEVGATVHAPGERDVFLGGRTPNVMDAIPLTSVVPADGLGLPSAVPGLSGTGLPGLSGVAGQPTEALNAPALPLLGTLQSMLPLPGLGSAPSLDSIGATSGDGLVPSNGAALPQAVSVVRGDAVHVLRSDSTESLPLVTGHLPVLTGNGLPSLPAELPVSGNLNPVGDMPIPVGGELLQRNNLGSYVPRHAADERPVADEESLPALAGLPLIGGLPVIGGLVRGGSLPL